MSLLTVIVLVAGYVALVAFVLALLTTAKRADEAAAAQHAAEDVREPARRAPARSGGRRFTPEDAEFLAGLDRRAARELERVPRRGRRDRE